MPENKTAKKFDFKTALPRIISMAIGAFIAIYCIVSAIYILATGNDPFNRFAAVLGGIFLGIAPFLIELIFRFKFSGYLLIFYMVFVFCASFLGCVLSFYKIYTVYDKIIHFIFGYIGGIAGLFLMCNLSSAGQNRAAFIILFCFAISMACGAIWEVFEYIGDNFFGQTAQGIPVMTVDGNEVVPLTDSMLDIVMNLGGALLFSLHYLLHALLKKDLLIDRLKNEFALSFKKEKKAEQI